MSTPGCSRLSMSRSATSRSSVTTSHMNSNVADLSLFGTRPSRPKSTTTGRQSRATSQLGGGESQRIICAISEARGVTPTVGLAFVNISTGEAVLSQICDNQFYAKSLNKIHVFEPTEILIVSSSSPPNSKSKMYQVIEDNVIGSNVTSLDRKYWSEVKGLEYISQLAFAEDLEAIKQSIGGNFYATCSLAAVWVSLIFSSASSDHTVLGIKLH